MESKGVLITGGSRGLGHAMAVAMINQGHRVAITGRDEERLREVERDLPGCFAVQADVADASRTASVVQDVIRGIGSIDVLINNAGIGGGEGGPQTLVDFDADVWWRIQETNVRGPMLYSKAVLPGMLERADGTIVNVGSYIAIRPSPLATAYGASKAALARFSDCLAAEVAEQGVQIFCVSPGLVLTDMTKDLPFIKEIPEDEFFSPEQLASLVCELMTGKYSDLSGHFIHVADDLPKLVANADRLRKERLHQLCMHGLDGLIE